MKGVKFYGKPHEQATVEDGVWIGEGTRIGQNSYIGKNTIIGKDCRILYHVTICKDAVIGNRVFIGPNTSFFNDKYPPTHISQPPIVEDDVVICGSANIGPGVIIHRGAVVGMGANVTKDVPPETVIITESNQKDLMTRQEYDRRQAELEERLG